jgi:hypothetical protein
MFAYESFIKLQCNQWSTPFCYFRLKMDYYVKGKNIEQEETIPEDLVKISYISLVIQGLPNLHQMF